MGSVSALIVPIAGPYTATWNGQNLGTQDDDGYKLRATYTGQEINQSDQFGMTLIEAIYRGINWRLAFTSIEFNRPGVLAAIQQFGSTGAGTTTFTPYLTNIGDKYSRYAQALVLTAILACQPQGTAFGVSSNPCFIATLTGLLASMAPQQNMEFLMTSKMRTAPFEMVLLPYLATVGSLSADLAFTTT